jgi:hypothetical protein
MLFERTKCAWCDTHELWLSNFAKHEKCCLHRPLWYRFMQQHRWLRWLT